jgi:major membrane immunogen (membrane-anchored lipoprotein)
MIRIAMMLLAAAVLTACATEHLVITDPGGRQWPVHIDSDHALMQVTIAGKAYRGHYVDNASSSSGFVTSFGPYMYGYGPFMYGYGPFMYPGFGTIQTYNPGNRGRAMLIAKDGDMLDCRYNYQGSTVVGTCRDRSGSKYAITSK